MSDLNRCDVAKHIFTIVRIYVDDSFESPDIYDVMDQMPIIFQEDYDLVAKAFNECDLVGIYDKWKDIAIGKGHFSEDEASIFINDIIKSLESGMFGDDRNYLCGKTVSIRGAWDDFEVSMPGVKAGWSIHLTVSGSADYNCMRKSFTSNVGDLVLLSPNAYYNFKRSDDADEWVHYWCVFPAEGNLLDLIDWEEVSDGIFHNKCIDETQMNKFVSIFEEIQGLSSKNDSTLAKIRRNLVEYLLLRIRENTTETQKVSLDNRVRKAIKFIENNFCSPIGNEDIATEASTSSSNLIKLFKKSIGISALELRDKKRMSMAADMLTKSKAPICEISNMVGFSDQMYFSRCFKKNFGKSPSTYRKEHLTYR